MDKTISRDSAYPHPRGSLTRAQIAGGALAAPLFVVVAVFEIFTRQGFDLRRHDLSLLSNGDLGWIQITNFIVTGLLLIGAASGMRNLIRSGRASSWGPPLVALFGLGWLGAGAFVADPMNGFPPGTPLGLPAHPSWHSWMHLISGSVAFIALIAACFVFARRFASLRERWWAVYSVFTGIVVLTAFAGISTGSQQLSVGFFIAGVLALLWVSALSVRLIVESR